MAIAPTPNNSLFKGFTFDGVDSRDFGVYISGDAVFNAPERDVEMIEIPGRNGAYALDNGRFSNIAVTYPAGLFGTTEAEFAEGISALRNALASRKGYCRLEDDYNPNEYRMAVYKSGLDVTPAMLKAGEFDIVFECKPQRFLKIGETAQAVTSGGTLTNPTMFESRPLLQVWGFGNINVNTDTITINDTEIGDIVLSNGGYDMYFPFTEANLNAGDLILFNSGSKAGFTFGTSPSNALSNPTIQSVQGDTEILNGTSIESIDQRSFKIQSILNGIVFTAGTSQTKSVTYEINVGYSEAGGSAASTTINYTILIEYGVGSITIRHRYTKPSTVTLFSAYNNNINPITAYSTKGTLGEPLYFDLDIGEAYKEEGGEYISVNNAATFPAELPTLKAGANTFTFDNTITQFKVVPRWWRV